MNNDEHIGYCLYLQLSSPGFKLDGKGRGGRNVTQVVGNVNCEKCSLVTSVATNPGQPPQESVFCHHY